MPTGAPAYSASCHQLSSTPSHAVRSRHNPGPQHWASFTTLSTCQLSTPTTRSSGKMTTGVDLCSSSLAEGKAVLLSCRELGNRGRTCFTCHKCSSMLREKIRILSMYMNTKQLRKSRSMSFTWAWNTAEPLSPKGVTRFSKCPSRVLNAVYHSSPLRMQTRR